MGGTKEPSANSCGETPIGIKLIKKASQRRRWEPFRFRNPRRQQHRNAFSDTTATRDIASLSNEVETINVPSSTTVNEDCSTPTIECIEPNQESIGSLGSMEPEPNSCNKASISSDSENQYSFAQIVQWRGFLQLLKKGPGIASQTLPQFKPRFSRKKSKRLRDEMVPNLCSALDAEMSCSKSSWKNFSLSELEEATDNFSPENLIGEGGYAEVYKGKLKTGNLVAVKRLNRGPSEEMTIDFLSELGIVVHVDHPNIAKLIGYGIEGGLHLVLQLSPHGSLASLLNGSKEKLNWQIRFKIALGAAEGLCYLHEGCQRRIIHKDIKASNILLTEEFDAQICDFGLAKWLPDQWTHHTVSKVEGTFGYLPPEFFTHGIVDEKTDVYAFGVLLLELITGRQAIDNSHQSIVTWAKPLIRENKMDELVDPILVDAYDSDELHRIAATASICVHQTAANRPQMSQVVDILKGDLSSLEMLKQREKDQRTYSEEIFDAEEYNPTKYLDDLYHQMEILLEHSNDV
ncbi:receptor-like cytosolic serine/threonine-protein kinase RBK2 [Gossypium raimondii]|nr:receptor-like cytosolic serine/threonine-protein kinase RBK2 [Gossypium raimondii]